MKHADVFFLNTRI